MKQDHSCLYQCRPHNSLDELNTALREVVGYTPNSSSAQMIRNRARDIGDVVTGRRKGHVTEHGTVLDPGPVEKGKKIGRDIAADYIWERLRNTKNN